MQVPELRHPKLGDAVKGGHSSPPSAAAVLGGLDGVKQRLASKQNEARIAALKEALNYGKEGLKLVVQIVQTEIGLVQWEAYNLLWERASDRTRQDLLKYSPLRSDVGVNYTQLDRLLAEGRWNKADEETAALMLKVCDRQKEGYLRVSDIANFPCIDLGTIDTLWVKYSNGRFGFSIQKRIWDEVGGCKDADNETYCEFGDRIGWRVNNRWLGVDRLSLSAESLYGYFPNVAFLGGSEEHPESSSETEGSLQILPVLQNWDRDSLLESFFMLWLRCLFSRVGTCRV